MVVGFGRSVVHELENLCLQFLDVPDVGKINPRTIAESLVCFHARNSEADDILHTAEHEIVIDAEGRQLVPRLQPIATANDRYNFLQRPIIHHIDANKSVVELQSDLDGCIIRQLSRYKISKETTGSKMIEMRTSHSILSAIKTPVGYKSLALGVDSDGTQCLALVTSPTSVLKVFQESFVPCDLLDLTENTFLTLVAANLVAMAIVDPLISGQKIVVHNASDVTAHAINAHSSAKDCEVIYTAEPTHKFLIPNSWINLPPYLRRSDLSQYIPTDAACFVGLSNHSSENELMMLSELSSHCRKETAKTIYASDAINVCSSAAGILGHTLEKAVSYLEKYGGSESRYSPETISLGSLVTGGRIENPMTIIDWTGSTLLRARLTRLDIKPLFKGTKTYWLCGMSGALGISLCDWMIDQGVKDLVLTSRNPKIEPAWIETHERNGVVIKILLRYILRPRRLTSFLTLLTNFTY